MNGVLRIGEQLRTLRTAHGLRLKDVADRAGVSLSYLSDVERGRTMPSLVTVAKIAEVFDVIPLVLVPSADVEQAFYRGWNAALETVRGDLERRRVASPPAPTPASEE